MMFSQSAAESYASELYLIDPNRDEIRHQPDGPAAWFTFDHDQSVSQDFRSKYLEPCDISDILSFAVCQGGVVYLVQFLRTHGQHFASAQRWLLTQVGEVFAAHVRKHFSYMHAIEGQNQFLIARVLAESPLFAAISPREKLVCIGVLTGHTSESIARNLSISINSVLTYRRRLYEKLGISSQNELFVHIIDAMLSLSHTNASDETIPPLAEAAVRARRNGRPLGANLAFAQAFIS